MHFLHNTQYNLGSRNTDVWAENATAKVLKIGKDKLQLTVEQTPIAEWIQQLLERKNHEHLIEQQKISNSCGFHLLQYRKRHHLVPIYKLLILS